MEPLLPSATSSFSSLIIYVSCTFQKKVIIFSVFLLVYFFIFFVWFLPVSTQEFPWWRPSPMQGVHGHLPPGLPSRSTAPAWSLAQLASSGLHPAPCSVDPPPWDMGSKPTTAFACLLPLCPLPPAFLSNPPIPHLRTRPVCAARPAPHSLHPCVVTRREPGFRTPRESVAREKYASLFLRTIYHVVSQTGQWEQTGQGQKTHPYGK